MFYLSDVNDVYTVGIIDTIWPIAFVLLVSFVFFYFKDQIRGSIFRKAIPALLLGLMLVFESGMLWNIIKSPWSPFEITVMHLPLHLCSISAVLVLLYLITKKEIILELLILQGIVGAIVTFVFPSTEAFPFTYEYIRFFLSHTLLFITPMFYIIIEKKKIDAKILKKAFISIHIFAAIAVFFNLVWGSHYMYILPDNEENLYHFLPLLGPMPFLGNWPWVIVVGELLVFPVYFLFYFGLRKFQTLIK